MLYLFFLYELDGDVRCVGNKMLEIFNLP